MAVEGDMSTNGVEGESPQHVFRLPPSLAPLPVGFGLRLDCLMIKVEGLTGDSSSPFFSFRSVGLSSGFEGFDPELCIFPPETGRSAYVDRVFGGEFRFSGSDLGLLRTAGTATTFLQLGKRVSTIRLDLIAGFSWLLQVCRAERGERIEGFAGLRSRQCTHGLEVFTGVCSALF